MNPSTVNIRQLHEKTGQQVRAVRESAGPIQVTDRGKVVALLVAPEAVPSRTRKRRLLPDYKRFLENAPTSGSVLEDLDAIRGDR